MVCFVDVLYVNPYSLNKNVSQERHLLPAGTQRGVGKLLPARHRGGAHVGDICSPQGTEGRGTLCMLVNVAPRGAERGGAVWMIVCEEWQEN